MCGSWHHLRRYVECRYIYTIYSIYSAGIYTLADGCLPTAAAVVVYLSLLRSYSCRQQQQQVHDSRTRGIGSKLYSRIQHLHCQSSAQYCRCNWRPALDASLDSTAVFSSVGGDGVFSHHSALLNGLQAAVPLQAA